MKIGTSGMTVPRRVLTKPPDEAMVTAVVVLKFETIISLPAEISNKPTGERIRAIDRLVVISAAGAPSTARNWHPPSNASAAAPAECPAR